MPIPFVHGSLSTDHWLHCVTGSAGVLGAFRCGALGAAGGLGGLAEIEGGGGKPDPFLIRTSPTSVLRLIFGPPAPTVNATLLLSPWGTSTVKSERMSPLWVNAFTVADALGSRVNSMSPLPLVLLASTLNGPAGSMEMLPSRSST